MERPAVEEDVYAMDVALEGARGTAEARDAVGNEDSEPHVEAASVVLLPSCAPVRGHVALPGVDVEGAHEVGDVAGVPLSIKFERTMYL